MSDQPTVVLTVRCTRCRQVRGRVVAHEGQRLWTWPPGRLGTSSASDRHAMKTAGAPTHRPAAVREVIADVTATLDDGTEVPIGPNRLNLAPCRCTPTSTPTDTDQIRGYLRAGRRVMSLPPVS